MTVAELRRLYEYERDAHRKTLTSLEAVAEGRRDEPAYRKAVGLVGHMAAARQLWLYRLGMAADAPRDFFPEGIPLAEARTRLERIEEAWEAYLTKLDDAGLTRTFTYQALDGGKFANVVGDILLQLFGHSWYHRGQVALLLRQMGETPAATDFVYWTREPLE